MTPSFPGTSLAKPCLPSKLGCQDLTQKSRVQSVLILLNSLSPPPLFLILNFDIQE